ncbi:hypothetical protein A5733_09630 [Mycobacterium sp. NS-7484]|uniref:hypothetical protein n=1 Tax=unclassified Mycobacterium TaxID=2642494 RepID=UPI0008004742|nr:MULTISPECIES: hypothetical protein [unclassified Mycobacterium]OBG83464.1 hypothetical protein A5699_04180 [Mycobacterium sp. E802]OMB97473.1 hypothetical protein A5733_09630 [Mycobacterium sp. NS-7484]
MTTNAVGSTVIELATHPVWCSSQQYSRELAEARRRHPSSYRLDTETHDTEADGLDSQLSSSQRAGARVITLACARGARLKAVRAVAEP